MRKIADPAVDLQLSAAQRLLSRAVYDEEYAASIADCFALAPRHSEALLSSHAQHVKASLANAAFAKLAGAARALKPAAREAAPMPELELTAPPETVPDTDAAALKKAEANRKNQKREKQKAKKAAVKEAIDISDAMMLFGELPGNPVHAASPAVASARRPLSVQASLTVFRSGRVRAKIRVFVP